MVTTAQITYILLHRRTFCFQFLSVFLCYCILFICVNNLSITDSLHVCKGSIHLNGFGKDQTISFSVLCDISKLVIDCFLYSIQLYFFSVYKYLTGNLSSIAFSENTHGKFCTSCTHKSGDTYNFPFMHLK